MEERKEDLSGKELTERLFLRESSVLSEMEDRYGKTLLSLAKRITGSEEDGRECVSDTMLSAWEHIPPERPENLGAWLCVICRRKCFDRLRRDHRIRRGSGTTVYLLSDYEEILTASEGPEDILAEKELERILNAFLLSQNRQKRTLFIGRYFDNRSVKDLSEMCGITVSAVNKALSSMKRDLAEQLRKEGYEI